MGRTTRTEPQCLYKGTLYTLQFRQQNITFTTSTTILNPLSSASHTNAQSEKAPTQTDSQKELVSICWNRMKFRTGTR